MFYKKRIPNSLYYNTCQNNWNTLYIFNYIVSTPPLSYDLLRRFPVALYSLYFVVSVEFFGE